MSFFLLKQTELAHHPGWAPSEWQGGGGACKYAPTHRRVHGAGQSHQQISGEGEIPPHGEEDGGAVLPGTLERRRLQQGLRQTLAHQCP